MILFCHKRRSHQPSGVTFFGSDNIFSRDYANIISGIINFVAMKQTFILFSLLALLTACTGKTAKQTAVTDNTESVNTTDSVTVAPTTEEPTSDEVVCKAIADFLGGNDSAVRFTDHARQDLTESSWPEVQCSVDGNLDSPASFKDVTVRKVGPGLYKYEAVCPTHDDRYIDCCTISAYIARDEVVVIEGVKWDDAVK